MSLVLDSSATLAWIYDDETTDAIREVFDAVTEGGAVVPPIWRVEVGNSLLVAVRRGRITANFRTESLADLALLKVRIDPGSEEAAWSMALALADAFRLTLYDALYLELAQRRSLPLASLDNELRAASRVLNLTLLGKAE